MSNVKEFWETAHKNNTLLWLSGTHLNEIWGPMMIIDKLSNGIKVLNIGVGLGNDTKELQFKGAIVDVLDISETAINKVKNITRNQFLSSNIDNLPINEYDIVTSHLVTQHINDEELNRQMKYIIPSLKPDGIFAMQFAYVDDVDIVSQDEERQMGGGVIRKITDIEKFVKNNNGYISWASEPVIFNHTEARWKYIHIKKNIIND